MAELRRVVDDARATGCRDRAPVPATADGEGAHGEGADGGTVPAETP